MMDTFLDDNGKRATKNDGMGAEKGLRGFRGHTLRTPLALVRTFYLAVVECGYSCIPYPNSM